MSRFRWTKRSSRMWAMFLSDPVSRLSTQITRWPRAKSSSHRCEPRNPAPPVTRQLAMALESSVPGATRQAASSQLVRSARRTALPQLARSARRAGPGCSAPLLAPAARHRPLHPLALLALPDRCRRLDLVDDLAGARKRLGAVGGGSGDRHRWLR